MICHAMPMPRSSKRPRNRAYGGSQCANGPEAWHVAGLSPKIPPKIIFFQFVQVQPLN
jgi:hypothetical protein